MKTNPRRGNCLLNISSQKLVYINLLEDYIKFLRACFDQKISFKLDKIFTYNIYFKKKKNTAKIC